MCRADAGPGGLSAACVCSSVGREAWPWQKGSQLNHQGRPLMGVAGAGTQSLRAPPGQGGPGPVCSRACGQCNLPGGVSEGTHCCLLYPGLGLPSPSSQTRALSGVGMGRECIWIPGPPHEPCCTSIFGKYPAWGVGRRREWEASPGGGGQRHIRVRCELARTHPPSECLV